MCSMEFCWQSLPSIHMLSRGRHARELSIARRAVVINQGRVTKTAHADA